MADTNTNRANPIPAAQTASIPQLSGFVAERAGAAGDLMIEATPEMRRATYADFAMARVNGANSMLDFVLVDAASAEGSSGVLAARVVMGNDALIALRDTLNDLTKDWRPAQH